MHSYRVAVKNKKNKNYLIFRVDVPVERDDAALELLSDNLEVVFEGCPLEVVDVVEVADIK